MTLLAKKATKFQQKDRKTKATQSVYATTNGVKHGVHTASKVEISNICRLLERDSEQAEKDYKLMLSKS